MNADHGGGARIVGHGRAPDQLDSAASPAGVIPEHAPARPGHARRTPRVVTQNAAVPRPWLRLTLLAVATLAACAAFALYGTLDAWALVGPMRLTRLGALVLVGIAVAVSTVLFQTVTDNRILAPSVLGFDSLYVLIQTVAVLVLGAGAGVAASSLVTFSLELGIMVAASLALFTWILRGAGRSIYLLVLVGIVLGTFLRSIATFLQRILSPDEFLVVQDAMFASFSSVDPDLLGLSTALVGACCLVAARYHRTFDVLALGRTTSITLGVDHRRWVVRTLALCAVLVSVSTALVGPVTFFGLLVAHLGYQLAATHRHAVTLPAAALVAILTLVGGQAILEFVLGRAGVLSVVIEFVGGIVFLYLLIRGGHR